MMEEFWRNRLCDAYEGDDVLDDDGDENGQLYEHFRMIADKGQQLLRIDKFLFCSFARHLAQPHTTCGEGGVRSC